MDRLDDYVQIMLDGLEKKLRILDILIDKNEKQRLILVEGEFSEINWSQFNILVAEKEAEIERINEMDEGFQALYDRVGEQLKGEKDKYAVQIKRMQQIISQLEDKSVKIRTGEERNKKLIEKILGSRKREIKQARTSLKVAANYYQSMSKAMDVDSAAVDKKK